MAVTVITIAELVYVVVLATWILVEKRSPVATMAWILAIIALPYLGFVVFFFFFGPRRILSPLLCATARRVSFRISLHTRAGRPGRVDTRLVHMPSPAAPHFSTALPQPHACMPAACLVSRVSMDQTNVDRALAALEEQHADDPERVELLRRTRRFKSSWLQLGEALSEVKRSKTWERWGYESMEAYAKAELKLRMDTVEKLTGSYMFLHKSAPEVLRRDPLASHLPSYQAIDFLRRAEERNEQSVREGGDHTVSEETMGEVRKKVLDEGLPMATVARLYKDSLFPVSESEKKTKEKKDIKAAAAKLKELLAETQAVPRHLASTVGDALDELLADLAADKKAA